MNAQANNLGIGQGLYSDLISGMRSLVNRINERGD